MNQLLGYWILKTGIVLPANGSVEYGGLDRMTQIGLPGPHEDRELLESGRADFHAARNDYWEAEESHQLNKERLVAISLCDRFRKEGLEVEVVFAEVLSVPQLPCEDDELNDHMRKALLFRRSVHDFLVAPDYAAHLEPIGIDVVYPNPSFHSAVYQPVLSSILPGFERELNEHGLYPSLESAHLAVSIANDQETSWRPFCPVKISRVVPYSTPRM